MTLNWLEHLPKVQGRYTFDRPLKDLTWFKVGGETPLLFRPKDKEDLAFFLKNKPQYAPPVFPMGMGSNLLVRDGGIEEIVIRLGGSSFSYLQKDTLDPEVLLVGAGCLDRTIALNACHLGIGGMEFLIGIPGTIGGGVFMNAGAYGREIKDILLWAEVLDEKGNTHILTPSDLGFSYRSSSLPKEWTVTNVVLKGWKEEPSIIAKKLQYYLDQRDATQPIRNATGGSTFKNPPDNMPAWKLIDEAGCRGLRIGDAEISVKHCNFMINTGNATAYELESLGELVRQKVFEKTGVMLEWEIIRIGMQAKKS